MPYKLTDERYTQILAWIEGVSGNKLNEIPAGMRGDGSKCPLARATGFCIGLRTYWDQPFNRMEIPDYVAEFARAYDQREINNGDLKR